MGQRRHALCVEAGRQVVAVGRQRHCEVAAVAEQLSRKCDASDRALFKRRLRLTSGARHFFIY
jgi:hypothetical protein